MTNRVGFPSVVVVNLDISASRVEIIILKDAEGTQQVNKFFCFGEQLRVADRYRVSILTFHNRRRAVRNQWSLILKRLDFLNLLRSARQLLPKESCLFTLPLTASS